MESLRFLYKIGKGPSSSHTMGPQKAAAVFKELYPDADEYKAVLYGSLSDTGKGHKTDEALAEAFAPKKCEIVFTKPPYKNIPHVNTIDLIAIKGGKESARKRVMSVGGGNIAFEDEKQFDNPDIYKLSTFTQISEYCRKKNMRLSDYVFETEGEEIKDYLFKVWQQMQKSILAGLSTTGTLGGGLKVERKAQYLYNQSHIDESDVTKQNRLICAYAYAASENNAGGGITVTAPTCGACAVVPSVLKFFQEKKGFSDSEIIKALAVGGLIGNIVKTNASISGAECGCQAEIGTACSMAAAALCELFNMGLDQIEYAAEVSMEHMLGLTCDPILGLVQIPCIERNAVAAMRAVNAMSLANFLSNTRRISFDSVVDTMYRTGKDISSRYKETSQGGLAKVELRKTKRNK